MNKVTLKPYPHTLEKCHSLISYQVYINGGWRPSISFHAWKSMDRLKPSAKKYNAYSPDVFELNNNSLSQIKKDILIHFKS